MAFMTIVLLLAIILVVMLMIFIFWVGTLVLEVFLSRMEQSWPGLILPGIIFGIALFIVLGIAIIGRNSLKFSDAYILFGLFCKMNIVTVIYLIIYFIVRLRRKKKLDLVSKTNTDE